MNWREFVNSRTTIPHYKNQAWKCSLNTTLIQSVPDAEEEQEQPAEKQASSHALPEQHITVQLSETEHCAMGTNGLRNKAFLK